MVGHLVNEFAWRNHWNQKGSGSKRYEETDILTLNLVSVLTFKLIGFWVSKCNYLDSRNARMEFGGKDVQAGDRSYSNGNTDKYLLVQILLRTRLPH